MLSIILFYLEHFPRTLPIAEADKLQSIKDVNQFFASIYRQSFPDSDKILWSSKAETLEQTEFDQFLYNNFKIILDKRLKEIHSK